MRIDKYFWAILLGLAGGVISSILYHLVGFWASMLWSGFDLLIVFLVSKMFRKRIKKDEVKLWQEAHPGVGEEFLPEHLRD